MDLTLCRSKYTIDGIFSVLEADDMSEEQIAVTLEHAYDRDDPEVAPSASAYPAVQLVPKVPPGKFTCVRGLHHLQSMPNGQTFETFEITGIPGHSGIIFHWGNWNTDSKGCPLLGTEEAEGTHAGRAHVAMVANSRAAFQQFMDLQAGVDSFTLTVVA